MRPRMAEGMRRTPCEPDRKRDSRARDRPCQLMLLLLSFVGFSAVLQAPGLEVVG